jgi:outer membrane lipoprotein-sorting protein
MFLRVFIIVLSVFFGYTSMFSQNVDEIIQKSLATRGDTAAYNKIKSMIIMVHQSQMGMSAPIKYYRKDKKCRLETEAMGTVSIYGYDGDSLWVKQGGQMQVVPSEYIEQVLQQLQQIEHFIKGPLVDYKEKGHKIEYSGTVNEEGRDCFTLKLKDEDNESFLYIDKNTYELFKIWVSVKGQNDETIEVELKLSDYKKVNDFSYPFKMSLKIGEQGTTEFAIDSLEINTAIDDALFKIPKADIKAPGTEEAPKTK